MNATVPLHPALAIIKERIAVLLEEASGTVVSRELSLGTIHRKALDARLSLQDEDTYKAFSDFCDAIDTDMLLTCPLFSQWINEGMSPVAYFSCPRTATTCTQLYEHLFDIHSQPFESALLLGNLTLAEFSRAFADFLSMSRRDIPDMRRIGDALPGIYKKANWPNLLPGQFSQHDELNQKFSVASSDIIPAMALDTTGDQEVYRQAEEFFYRPGKNNFGQLYPVIEQLHESRSQFLMDTIVNHVYGGWATSYTDKALVQMLNSLALFELRDRRALPRWMARNEYLITRATEACGENPDLLWPHQLARTIAMGTSNKHLFEDQEQHKSMDALLKRAEIGRFINADIKALIEQSNAENLFDISYSKLFLAHVSVDKKMSLIKHNIPRLAITIKRDLRKNQYNIRHESIPIATASVDPEVMEALSKELRTLVDTKTIQTHFKSRYLTLVWFQSQGLKGIKRQQQAIAYCQSMPTADLKAIAADYLQLPIEKLSLSDQEQEVFLQRNLGL
ncbi:hypothetical protein [Pseudomonas sp. S1(2024)]|uniref:hypothetical protein n=1 Tax=Pseudomonas sp. S1(2024) TaxID=3390191 RepID=UPI00397A82D9